MAELKLFDIAGSFNQGYDRGQQLRKTSRLAELASQAYAAPTQQRDAFVQQAVANDPSSGFQLAQSLRADQEARTKELVNRARFLANVPEGQRSATYASMVPDLRRMGIEAPDAYDQTVDQAVKALVQAYGASGQQEQGYTLGPGSRRYDANNNVVAEVPFAPASSQIVEVPDGMGGKRQMEFNPRTREWSAPAYGAAPAASPTGERRDAFDQFIGPILADAEASGSPLTGQEFMELYRQYQPNGPGNIAVRDGQPMVTPGGTGESPPTISAAQVPPSGGLGYTPPPRQDAPSGFRYAPDGVTLEPIPGGPQDSSSPVAAFKDEQSMRKEVADLVKQDRTIIGMYSNVQNAARNPSAAGDLSMIFAFMKMLDPGSVVREQEFANAQNAAGIPDQIRNAYNRALEGQRLNPAQRADFLSQAAKLQAEAQARITSVTRRYQGIADQYGFDPQRATGAPDFRNVGTSGPKPGQVEDGYRFVGGDPADPNSWERI